MNISDSTIQLCKSMCLKLFRVKMCAPNEFYRIEHVQNEKETEMLPVPRCICETG